MTDQTHQTVSVKAAAALLGISDGAVLKRIERGTLAAEKDARRQWRITLPADLPDGDQTPGQDTSPDTDQTRRTRQRHVSGPSGNGSAALEAETAALRAQIELLTGTLEDTRADRDHWQEQARQLTRLLDQQQQLALPGAIKEMPALVAPGESPSVWQRVRAFFSLKIW